MSGDGAQIETILQLVQGIFVLVNDGYVVGLVGQVFRQRATNLSGTEYQNFHLGLVIIVRDELYIGYLSFQS